MYDSEALLSTYHQSENQQIVKAAAQLVDNGKAGTLSRLAEIVEFSKSMNFQNIGIAYCWGMENDARLVSQYLRESGLKPYPVSCTTGGFKQSDVNADSTNKAVACNPLAQAEQLNQEVVDFTLTMGLCLGHDIIFQKQIKSYTSTLIVKDRVHGNNPIKALRN